MVVLHPLRQLHRLVQAAVLAVADDDALLEGLGDGEGLADLFIGHIREAMEEN